MKNENVMLSYEMKGYGVWLEREGIVTKEEVRIWRLANRRE